MEWLGGKDASESEEQERRFTGKDDWNSGVEIGSDAKQPQGWISIGAGASLVSETIRWTL